MFPFEPLLPGIIIGNLTIFIKLLLEWNLLPRLQLRILFILTLLVQNCCSEQ